MSNLEIALRMNLMEEMSALPAEFEHYEHSPAYQKEIQKLIDRMRGGRLHKYTRKATLIILIAAILFAFAIAGFAAIAYREFTVRTYYNHYEYTVSDAGNGKAVTAPELGYIPAGFELSEESNLILCKWKKYVCEDQYFVVKKYHINTLLNYDNDLDYETIERNGVKYVYGKTDQRAFKRLIWNDGDHIYFIKGYLSEEELFKIADGIIKK